MGVVVPDDLQYAAHPERAAKRARLPIAREAVEIEAAARVLLDHPDYAAPERVLDGVRALLTGGKYRMFDS